MENNKIIQNHSYIESPKWNEILWRYMSFEKFFDLIQTNSIYFSNCNSMTDKNESSIPESTIKEYIKLWEYDKIPYLKSIGKNEIDNRLTYLKNRCNDYKSSTLINCWSKSRDENFALWKLYLGGAKSGVAITTNSKFLNNSFYKENKKSKIKIYIGNIDYNSFINPVEFSWAKIVSSKRKPYQYENEVRLFIFDENNASNLNAQPIPGVSIKCDLNILIKDIYLSPFAGEWFYNMVTNYLFKNNRILASRIVYSEINER